MYDPPRSTMTMVVAIDGDAVMIMVVVDNNNGPECLKVILMGFSIVCFEVYEIMLQQAA